MPGGRSIPPIESAAERATPPSGRGRTARYVLAIVAVLVGLAIYNWFFRQHLRAEAVEAIPAQSREQLYQRLLENLRFCNSNSSAGLERFCTGEAEFILLFPECDRECRELTRRYETQPMR